MNYAVVNNYGVSSVTVPGSGTVTVYFFLLAAGGKGAAYYGAGSGGIFYGSVNLNAGTIIYTLVPSGSGQNGSVNGAFISLQPITTNNPNINGIPFAWSGNEAFGATAIDGSIGTGGSFAVAGTSGPWNSIPAMYLTDSNGTQYPITLIDAVNGTDGAYPPNVYTTAPTVPAPWLNYTASTFTSDAAQQLAIENAGFGAGGWAPSDVYGDNGGDGLIILGWNTPITFSTPIGAVRTPKPITRSNGVHCFPKGTTIMTPEGYKAVETLEQGSLVTTSTNNVVPIKNIYKTIIKSANVTNAPYFIPKHSLGSSPVADLRLSPQHAFQVRKDVWVSPKYAAELTEKVHQYGLGEPITYYHVECPNFFKDNLIVDGTVVESYGTNQTKGMKAVYIYSPALKAFTRASQPRNTILKGRE
jgi:hypothetical protein